MLLLLDNLEQVIEAAPALSGLVQACPNLTLFVHEPRAPARAGRGRVRRTSARSLGGGRPLLRALARLEPSRNEIAELCARLDDLPLAVELAAARTRPSLPRRSSNASPSASTC